jgi:hypothetical protein
MTDAASVARRHAKRARLELAGAFRLTAFSFQQLWLQRHLQNDLKQGTPRGYIQTSIGTQQCIHIGGE